MIDIDFLVQSPAELALDVARREKDIRKKRGMTQSELARRASVSLGSLRRFEQTGLIAFDSLIRISLVLECGDDIANLFRRKAYSSIEEVINERT